MTDFAKSLEDSVDQDEAARKRAAILKNFQDSPQATLEDLFNVCENSKLGPVMKTISLAEIFSAAPQNDGSLRVRVDIEDEIEVEVDAAPARKAKKKASKKAAKAAAPAKAKSTKAKATKAKATKAKPPKAKSTKAKATKAKSSNGVTHKAASAAGGRKERQDYDALAREVVAYMGKQGKPLSTGDLQKKFNISGSQARKVCELLVGQKMLKRLGKGGRGVKYDVK